MEQTFCHLFETPLGVCGIGWRLDANGEAPVVVCLQLPETTVELTAARLAATIPEARPSAPPPGVAGIIARLQHHLRGEAQDFSDLAVDPVGATPFARLVYGGARRIPAGQTLSYGELARNIGRPAAARAIGQALGRNPIPLIIPCHRVLAAGGRPGGFSAPGGVATKSRLLLLEGIRLGG